MKKIRYIFILILLNKILFSQQISLNDKILGFSKVWKEMEYNFAYFHDYKINNDSLYKTYLNKVIESKNDFQYYEVLQEYLAFYHDGHTKINIPTKINIKTSPMIIPYYTNNCFYVIGIGEQYQNEINIGDEIISINGVNTLKYIDSLYQYYNYPNHVKYNYLSKYLFYNKIGYKYNLVLKKINGEIYSSTLIINNNKDKWYDYKYPFRYWQSFHYKLIDNNIAYISFGSNMTEKSVKEFESIIDTLKTTTAVIIDLRNNYGGSSVGAKVCKYFTKDSVFISQIVETRENNSAGRALGKFGLKDFVDYSQNNYYKRDTLFIQNNKKIYIDKPLFILINENTASAAEAFALTFKYINKGIIIGNNSYGSISQPLFINLPLNGTAQISTQRVLNKEGTSFQYIQPDYYINTSIEDIINFKDKAIEKVTQLLNNK